MNVTIVSGPPCSGKTEYVQQHKRPGDLVWDVGAMRVALGCKGPHHARAGIHGIVRQLRSSFMQYLDRNPHDTDVWIISSDPLANELQALPSEPRRVLLYLSRSECRARATQRRRPIEWQTYIESWYRQHAHYVTDECAGLEIVYNGAWGQNFKG